MTNTQPPTTRNCEQCVHIRTGWHNHAFRYHYCGLYQTGLGEPQARTDELEPASHGGCVRLTICRKRGLND